MTTLVSLLMVFVVLAAVAMLRHHDPLGRARALRRSGFGWMVAFAVLAGLFIAGETFSDPGGIQAAGMVLAWLVPVAALSALAWYRPAAALPLLGALVVVVVVYCAWSAGSQGPPRGLRDKGPFDAIAVFVVSVALGFLGLHRPRPAGLLLLVTSLVPAAVLVIGSSAPLNAALTGSLGAASLPGLVSAGLFLLADREARHQPSPTHAKLPAPPR
ncbi:MAG: hypothetical protein ACTHN8_03060 [Angustibacter sp.]